MGKKNNTVDHKLTVFISPDLFKQLEQVGKQIYRGMNKSQTIRCLIEDAGRKLAAGKVEE